MKSTRKPIHPGIILKEDYIIPLELSVTSLSLLLGISRKTLSKIINEKASISPTMALRLSRAFDTSPNLWLNLQKKHDLWEAENESDSWLSVKPISSKLLHVN